MSFARPTSGCYVFKQQRGGNRIDTVSYPALHLYIYTALQRFLPGEISSATQVRAGQYVFLALYLVTLALVSIIYYLAGFPVPSSIQAARAEVGERKVSVSHPAKSQAQSYSPFPQALLIPLTLSKRLHSIYVLRLFNDPFAMVLVYASVVVMMAGQRRAWGWTWGCRLFS